MVDEELISKKDLLLMTGISYGQLYRWKRQQLIPDSWFIKQSAYTGQETFFPKQKVLERIQTILTMKDTRSLEELAAYFKPESMDRTYSILDAMDAAGLDSGDVDLCIKLWGKHRVTFKELLLLSLLTELRAHTELTQENRRSWLLTAREWANVDSQAEQLVIVFRKGNELVYLLVDAMSRFELDEGSGRIAVYDLSERSKQLGLRLETIKGE